MVLRPVESFSLDCDRCGTSYEDGDFSIFGPGWDPRESAADGDWWCGDPVQEEERGPAGRDLCPGCLTRAWTDDDEVLEVTELPIPAPHKLVLVRDPRWTAAVVPGEWCKQDGCHLMAKHEVHK